MLPKIDFKDVGKVKKGEISLGNLTLLCGENNTGKTYISYALYGVLKEMRNIRFNFESINNLDLERQDEIEINLKEEFLNQFESILTKFTQNYSKGLYKVFNTSKDSFTDSKIGLELDKTFIENYIYSKSWKMSITIGHIDTTFYLKKPEESFSLELSFNFEKNEEFDESDLDVTKIILNRHLKNLVLESVNSKVFLLPAERAGLNLFYKELNANRNELIHEFNVEVFNEKDFRRNFEKSINPYPLPISDYITFLNRQGKPNDDETEFEDIARDIEQKILGGSYEVEDQNIFFKPTLNKEKISLHVSSSTAKSLFGLVYYMDFLAEKGNYLIIDEPELNLHPKNQRVLARILSKAANKGLNVIISTHSDHMLKEINSLVILSNSFNGKERLLEEYDIDQESVLKKEKVSANVFKDSLIEKMPITEEDGIIADTFDDVINAYNDQVDDIYFTYKDDAEE